MALKSSTLRTPYLYVPRWSVERLLAEVVSCGLKARRGCTLCTLHTSGAVGGRVAHEV